MKLFVVQLLLLVGYWSYCDSLANVVNKVAIIYVYTIHKNFCQYGIPDYLVESIEHAVKFQKHARVILGLNFQGCAEKMEKQKLPPGLELVDIAKISSQRTKWYANHSPQLFPSDYQNELWISSALRFFNIEDIMYHLSIDEAFHVEGDNLLYGQVYQIVPILKSHYPLASVPQTANRVMITASIFWISNRQTFRDFTDYLLDILVTKIKEDISRATSANVTISNNSSSLPKLVHKDNVLQQYVGWLRQFKCQKKDGVLPDENGVGIRPFCINEMTMLAHYQHIFPERMINLPVVPYHADTPRRRPFSDVKVFARGGSNVGTWSTDWIWDGASWGQYLGGTHAKRGNNLKFIDPGHIQGQAIIQADCLPRMVCDNILYDVIHHAGCKNLTESRRKEAYDETLKGYHGFSSVEQCLLVPMVSCNNVGDTKKLFPIFNLHVHAKTTSKFVSTPCSCEVSPMDQVPVACRAQ